MQSEIAKFQARAMTARRKILSKVFPDVLYNVAEPSITLASHMVDTIIDRRKMDENTNTGRPDCVRIRAPVSSLGLKLASLKHPAAAGMKRTTCRPQIQVRSNTKTRAKRWQQLESEHSRYSSRLCLFRARPSRCPRFWSSPLGRCACHPLQTTWSRLRSPRPCPFRKSKRVHPFRGQERRQGTSATAGVRRYWRKQTHAKLHS